MKNFIIFSILFFGFTLSDSFADRNPFSPQIPKKVIEMPSNEFIEEPEPVVNNKPVQPIRPVRQEIQETITAPIKPPELQVTGVVWNSDRPQAIINNTVVDIGDRLLNTQIVSITKEYIEIEFNNEYFKITP